MSRRIWRLALAALSALCLILCATLVALWVQSHRQRYVLSHGRAEEREREWVGSAWQVSLEPGCVYVGHGTDPPYSKSDVLPGPMGEARILVRDPPPTGFRWAVAAPGPAWDWALDRPYVRWEVFRFVWAVGDFPKFGGASFRLAVVPLYALVMATALPPVVWMRGWLWRRRADRRPEGICPQCGYDLRATPGRCPECGVMAVDAADVAGKRPRDGRSSRPKPPPYWADWPMAIAWVGVAVAVLAVALLPLSSLIPPPPAAPPSPLTEPTVQP